MIERSRRVVEVADGSKLGRVAFAQICPLEMVDELITDAAAPAGLVGRLTDAGLAVTPV